MRTFEGKLFPNSVAGENVRIYTGGFRCWRKIRRVSEYICLDFANINKQDGEGFQQLYDQEVLPSWEQGKHKASEYPVVCNAWRTNDQCSDAAPAPDRQEGSITARVVLHSSD